MYCDVLILNQESNYDQIFTYQVPAHWEMVQVGLMVSVPVRQHKQRGLILQLTEQKPALQQIRPAEAILDPQPVITAQGLRLAQWLSSYYACSLNKAVHLFLIPQIRQRVKLRLLPGANFSKPELLLGRAEQELLALMGENPAGLPLEQVRRKLDRTGEEALKYLVKNDYLKLERIFAPRVLAKQTQLLQLTAAAPPPGEIARRSPRQAQIIEFLSARGSVTLPELKAALGEISTILAALKKKGWVAASFAQIQRDPLAVRLTSQRPTELNEEQRDAAGQIMDSVRRSSSDKWLVYGVTGSGKTEVYLQSIAEALQLGKQVLYLVPEISLTPQITSILLEAFAEQVAILHSSLSAGERFDQWNRISAGQARVIVGPRSAVFAPFVDLGLIIVDEEHENTYKGGAPPPVCGLRCGARGWAGSSRAEGGMGWATPSLPGRRAAEIGEFRLLRLTRRVADRSMPAIMVIDMKEQQQGNRGLFSSPLLAALEKALAAGEQAIIFLNRRGYNTFVLCRECGTALSCPHCAITLTYHQARQKLVCHYCNYTRSLPQNCPSCGGRFMRYLGSGTERVAQELQQLFPQAGVLRMDADTTRLKGSHTTILQDFQEGKGQILVGTQMIAKGLDFPAVTLVGIINTDSLLNMPDYQSGERAFQLLSQVSGRAGRGDLPGQVIIQTFNPENYLFPVLADHSYEEFTAKEMANREILSYPPFVVLARVLVSGSSEKNVAERVDYLAKLLKIEIDKAGGKVEMLGPSPAPLNFMKGRYRHHLILKSTEIEKLQELAHFLRQQLQQLPAEPRVIIDLEAQTLL